MGITARIGADWPQVGQIWDFLRSVSVHIGAPRQNVLKLILKSPRFVPFGANLTQFEATLTPPGHYAWAEVFWDVPDVVLGGNAPFVMAVTWDCSWNWRWWRKLPSKGDGPSRSNQRRVANRPGLDTCHPGAAWSDARKVGQIGGKYEKYDKLNMSNKFMNHEKIILRCIAMY